MKNRVTVTVSGLTGSGKSRITHEIEVALKAVGVSVTWTDPADKREADSEAHSEQSGNWQPELPEVVLQEMNVPRRPREGFQMATGQRHAPVFETFKGLQFFDDQWHYVNHAGTWGRINPGEIRSQEGHLQNCLGSRPLYATGSHVFHNATRDKVDS